jgi:hypothetical protein
MIDNDNDSNNEFEYEGSLELSEINSNDDVLFFPEMLGEYAWTYSDPIFNEILRDKRDNCLPIENTNSDHLLNNVFEIYDKTTDTQLYKDTNWKKSNLLVITVGFTTFCKKWNNNKYKRFLKYIDNNISCKFSFVNNDASLYVDSVWWIYMDGYIYFSIYDYGSVYSYNKLKVDEIILNRLKKINEVIEKNNLDVIE